MHRWIRKLMDRWYRPILQSYLKRKVPFYYRGLKMKIEPSVFHPGFFGSSKVFAGFLEKQPVHGMSVLEIGCGSGFLSLVCARKGAQVVAADINERALHCTAENTTLNRLVVTTCFSNVFSGLAPGPYDIIVTNPPFYPGEPADTAGHAWYSGKEFRFFEDFFKGLHLFTKPGSKVWMVLSEDCEMVIIRRMAGKYSWRLKEVYQKVRLWEKFVVFEIYHT